MTRPGERLFIPLHMERGCYRESYNAALGDVGFQAELAVLLRRHGRRERNKIELRGRLYDTNVYRVPNEPNAAYVEANRDGVPIEAVGSILRRTLVRIQEYASRVAQRWRLSDTLTPDGGMPVDACFVMPRLAVVRNHAESVDNGTEISWFEFLNRTRTVVLGAPGAGKTSLLRRLAVEASKDRRSDTIPLYLQLRDVPLSDLSVDGLVRLLSVDDMPDLALALPDPGMSGRVLLLLDGLDEVMRKQDQTQVVGQIKELCTALPDIRVVLSSRDATYDWSLPDFEHIRLMPFDDARVAQLAYLLIGQAEPYSERSEFKDWLDDAYYGELLRNPLLLTSAAAAYKQRALRLSDRAGILRRCVDVLVDDWDDARGVRRWWRTEDLNSRQINSILASLSIHCMERNMSEFTVDDVFRLTDDHVGYNSTPLVFLSACHTAGLITSVDYGRWTFSHRAFQDMLAARRLVDTHKDGLSFLKDFYPEHPARRAWILSLAITGDAGSLLSGLLNDARIGPPHKAMLLADALAQDLDASRAVIVACCALLVSVLEGELASTKLTTATRQEDSASPSNAVQSRREIVWEARIAVKGGELQANRTTLIQLLELLYRTRHGSSRDEIEASLAASQLEVVRKLADCLDYDGQMQAIWTKSSDITGIVCSVSRPRGVAMRRHPQDLPGRFVSEGTVPPDAA
jgi:NACHT domain-containing protein